MVPFYFGYQEDLVISQPVIDNTFLQKAMSTLSTYTPLTPFQDKINLWNLNNWFTSELKWHSKCEESSNTRKYDDTYCWYPMYISDGISHHVWCIRARQHVLFLMNYLCFTFNDLMLALDPHIISYTRQGTTPLMKTLSGV